MDKAYRDKHQDKINEYKRIRIICECGCEVLKIDRARHCRSKKHLELLENNKYEE